MGAVINRVAEGQSTLVLLADRNDNVEKSSRNLVDVKTLRANYLNIRDLLGYNKIVVPLDALEVVNEFLGLEDAVEAKEES